MRKEVWKLKLRCLPQNKEQDANQSSSKMPTENPVNLNPNADMQEPGANMLDQKIQTFIHGKNSTYELDLKID